MVEELFGVVKWFDEKRGYGYITAAPDTENAKDYFVHYSSIVSKHKFKKLMAGWNVKFIPAHNEKGDYATEVVLVRS